MSIQLLRKFIHLILEKGEIIGEPDLTNQDDREQEKNKDTDDTKSDEMSAGGVGGVSTPLGTGPTYPAKVLKRTKKKSETK